jgi:predicted nucleotidyltransferase component of viral defense system
VIDVLRQQYDANMSAEEKTNRVREFLQIIALKIMSDKGYFKNIAFVGGTALRIIYNLRRFSDDLDFSLLNKKGFDFNRLVSDLEKEIKLFGLEAELKPKVEKVVQSVLVKFPGVLNEAGVTSFKEQKLAIKVEVDTNPPAGAVTQASLINRTYLFSIVSLDLSSLFATKLHACLFRKYSKGRDFYDLVWYLGKKIEPNYELLNNAIKQTEGKDMNLGRDNVKQFLIERLKHVDFNAAKRDVERFLEDRRELSMFDYELLKGVIESHMP